MRHRLQPVLQRTSFRQPCVIHFNFPPSSRTQYRFKHLHSSRSRAPDQPRRTSVSCFDNPSYGRRRFDWRLTRGDVRNFEFQHAGKRHELDSLILRDSCSCTRCMDPSTTQKSFDTVDIPSNILAKDLRVNSDGSFSVSWMNDVAGFEDHRSYFPSDFLSVRETPESVEANIRQRNPLILWNKASLEAQRHNMTVKYDDYMEDKRTFRHVIRQLFKYGIAFISKVPPISASVASIGNRLGGPMRTIYGATWDVRSLPSAKNVADTSSDLGFHMVSRVSLILHGHIPIS